MKKRKQKAFRQSAFMLLSFVLIFTISGQAVIPSFGVKTGTVGKTNKEDKSFKEIVALGPDETSNSSILDFGSLKGPKITAAGFAPQVASLAQETEPNNTPATATPIGNSVKLRGSSIFPNGDIDYFSFQANAGDRVYAATMTAFSAGNSTDSQLTLYASDGTTAIEFDDSNGTFAALASSIAGATIPTTGTYYLKVNEFTPGTTSIRPYELWFNLQSGAPTPEAEPNDTPGTANPLPANEFVSGARNPAASTEQDWYSFNLNAGDTVYLGLDLDPERDGVTWNGRVGLAPFGDAGDQILFADDAGAAETPTTIPSEALFYTVKSAGTYYAVVDSSSAAVGGPTATYHLSVSILPRSAFTAGLTCTTYTSTNVPLAIGPGTGLTSSTLTIPGNPRIASLRVLINLNHALMSDIDAHLRSPSGNDNGIFTDIGAMTTGGQQQMDAIFNDDAGVPPSTITVLKGVELKPELNYRLAWFNYENAGGTWTLDLRDDTAGANGGTLNSWGLEICEQPAPTGQVLYSQNFESGDGGFTHSGTQDEWELGLPATAATTTANPVAAFNTCNSGTNCWKTDLDSTYNVNANQDLFSPNLNLSAFTGTLQFEWAMRYQLESASFDHAYVEVQDVNNPANNRIVWQWLDATMTDAVGNPVVNIGASAGWGTYRADISDFAGKQVRLRFHLDTDNTVVFAGLVIDDVLIRGISVTSASVQVGGQVLSSSGRAIPNTTVTLTGAGGITQSARTNGFGYYRFDNVGVGETYILNATRKGYTFAPQVVFVQEEIADANLIASQ